MNARQNNLETSARMQPRERLMAFAPKRIIAELPVSLSTLLRAPAAVAAVAERMRPALTLHPSMHAEEAAGLVFRSNVVFNQALIWWSWSHGSFLK